MASSTESHIIQAPVSLPSDKSPSLFLSGSITAAPTWQDTLSTPLSSLPITILNPLRADWDSSWKEELSDPKFVEQVNWEQDAMEQADVIAVYFGVEAKAPITLLELGWALGKGKKVVVCCPEGYWKRGNVLVMCGRAGVKVVDTVEELEREVVQKFKDLSVGIEE